ncbi:MAG: GntR family transcriptional regulator [Peptostreptococcales bacterium]
MILELNFSSEVPIFIQIRQEVLRAIATGKLSEGEALPSVRQLASEIGINMHTVNKAYSSLKADGFIRIDRRKGAVVEEKRKLVTEAYLKVLDTDIENVFIEAICRGLTEEEMMAICREKYRKIGGR